MVSVDCKMAASSNIVLGHFQCRDDDGQDVDLIVPVGRSIIDLYGRLAETEQEKLISELMKHPKARLSYPQASKVDDQPSTSTHADPNPIANKNTPPAVGVHIWNDSETKLLINLRLQKESEFTSINNHLTLWQEISNQLSENKVHVSKEQARDKFNKLKQKWRSVLDNNNSTGKDRKDWKFSQLFDEVYGMRASSHPKYTIEGGSLNKSATDKDDAGNDSEDSDKAPPPKIQKKNDKSNPKIKKLDKSSTRDKMCQLMEDMKQRQEQMGKDIKQMHTDKMGVMNRLLNIMESKSATNDPK